MNTFFKSIKIDLPASLVVFIVAIPLSLGIALASGTSAASGLLAAAIGGLVVGALSGSPLMVSGPAAGLTVLVFQIVQNIGVTGLAIATVIAGVIQIILSRLKAGFVFQKIPGSVLNGMLAAIGLIILLGQLHVLLGQSVPESPGDAIGGLPASLSAALFSGGVLPVVWISLIALVTLFAWPSAAKRFSVLKNIPAALPAVIFATLVSIPLEVERMVLGNLLGSAWNSLQATFTAFGSAQWSPILIAAAGIAAVASAESLLTARAADILEKERAKKEGNKQPIKESDLDRELFAQGAGNAISGMIGGLPITGVIVRTAANVDAGGRTRASAMLHGVWIGVFALALPVIMNKIPLAALAAVLVVTGVKLLNVHGLLARFKENIPDAALWTFTIVAIVVTNLLTGLLLSLVVAILMNWRAAAETLANWGQAIRSIVGNENGSLGSTANPSASSQGSAKKKNQDVA